MDLKQDGEELKRGLKNRHIQLIALGGAIGTGLFLGIAQTIKMAGPSVLLGYAITRSTASVVMTGIGIIGLAGIVVKNGILVIEFADELRHRGMRTREAVIMAGKTRIVPVLLTALAAILALIPLAVGLNINFVTMFTDWNPHIFFGGDNVVFWKPLSWTIIWGLIFAFFMTLIMVPGMYLMAERLKRPMSKFYHGKWVGVLGLLGPLFFILPGLMYLYRKISGRPVWNGKLKG